MSTIIKNIGLYIFLILDVILAIIFVGLEPNPTKIITFDKNLVNFYLNPTTWILVLVGLGLQVLVVFYFAYRAIKKERKLIFFPEYLGVPNDLRLGKYTPEELKKLVEKMQELTGHKVNVGYISIEVLPKLVSHYIPGKGNRLYINSNLLQISGTEELTAALAIEFKNFNSLNNTFLTFLNYHSRPFLAVLFVRLLYPILTTLLFTLIPDNPDYKFDLQSFTALGWIFLAVLLIIFVLWQSMSFIIKSSYLNAHYAADREAAKVVGKNTTINMLVKLGQRSEALDVLLEEIKWLEEKRIGKVYEFDEEKLKEVLDIFPHDEISEHVARQKAPEVFLKSKFSHLTDFYYVEIPNLENIIDKASLKLLEERKKYIEERKSKLEEMGKKLPVDDTIDWRKFDVDGNLTLDEQEIEHFVKELKSSKKLLFENELAGDAFFKRRPPINKRIIKLYEMKN